MQVDKNGDIISNLVANFYRKFQDTEGLALFRCKASEVEQVEQFCGNKDTYLVSLFANAAGIMSEIVIGMKSFVFLAIAIITGVLIINLMARISAH